MDFRISDTFTDTLARLTNDEQKGGEITHRSGHATGPRCARPDWDSGRGACRMWLWVIHLT
jgi:hypothetical protein